MRLLFWLVAIGVVLGACYTSPVPCNPGSIDWPRCDPTQPKLGSRDGGND